MHRSGSAEKLFNSQLQYNLTEHLTDTVVDDQVGSPVCRGFGFVHQHQFVYTTNEVPPIISMSA